ncbi:hypothetical protein D6C98_03432 [Aureobasidium pullulans]|uniref:Uncharacterized protein n=1 Tax=Aureobasidium pullulans TaxID=5580 RepID=A0A4S9JNX4_AURPU|nr:hypothetical protein D6D26_05379 [Aureobasidium pullulans]THW24063.1 hypothetical protein D6D24_00258 [Aureobasidium pullulans]THX42737.1 hypothetical protein D6D10_01738 [Aureobasidium pullulans]THY03608.1 hypothetical protein D6D03_04319 [Aureobasidium pullulans]THY57484.1 hypothetical protein D6C98_03432 [Aureobasidium pullulans]
MFFAKTIVAAFAVVGSVSALPVQKRDDAVIGDPANPLDDLLTNVQGGLRGGLDFLSIPSGSSDKKKRDVIGDAASKQPLSILFQDIDSIQDTDEKQTHWMTC